MNNLDTMIKEALAPGGYAVAGGRELFMEVMDTSTGLYWMSSAPVTQTDFDTISVEPPLVKFDAALASMDRAAFQSSPGKPGDAVLEKTIDGRHFINVAAVAQSTPPAVPRRAVPAGAAALPQRHATLKSGVSYGVSVSVSPAMFACVSAWL